MLFKNTGAECRQHCKDTMKLQLFYICKA